MTRMTKNLKKVLLKIWYLYKYKIVYFWPNIEDTRLYELYLRSFLGVKSILHTTNDFNRRGFGKKLIELVELTLTYYFWLLKRYFSFKILSYHRNLIFKTLQLIQISDGFVKIKASIFNRHAN